MGGQASRRVRQLVLAFVVLLPLVAVGGESSPASAIPVIEYLGEEYELKVHNPVAQMCVGERATVVMTAQQFGVFRNATRRMNAPRQRPYRVDRGSGNLGVATLTVESSNSTILEKVGSSSYLTNGYLQHTVLLKAKKVGTSDVNINVQSPGVVGAGQTMIVNVNECDYKVVVFSIWHLNAGRNVVASSSIDTVITGQGHPTGSIYNARATSENIAVSFTPPCQAVYELPPTTAGVFATLRDDKLEVEVDYSPNAVTTGVTCGPVSGEANDPATLDPIVFNMHGGGGADFDSHVLHAPGLGDFTGMTYITVTPIPR